MKGTKSLFYGSNLVFVKAIAAFKAKVMDFLWLFQWAWLIATILAISTSCLLFLGFVSLLLCTYGGVLALFLLLFLLTIAFMGQSEALALQIIKPLLHFFSHIVVGIFYKVLAHETQRKQIFSGQCSNYDSGNIREAEQNPGLPKNNGGSGSMEELSMEAKGLSYDKLEPRHFESSEKLIMSHEQIAPAKLLPICKNQNFLPTEDGNNSKVSLSTDDVQDGASSPLVHIGQWVLRDLKNARKNYYRELEMLKHVDALDNKRDKDGLQSYGPPTEFEELLEFWKSKEGRLAFYKE